MHARPLQTLHQVNIDTRALHTTTALRPSRERSMQRSSPSSRQVGTDQAPAGPRSPTRISRRPGHCRFQACALSAPGLPPRGLQDSRDAPRRRPPVALVPQEGRPRLQTRLRPWSSPGTVLRFVPVTWSPTGTVSALRSVRVKTSPSMQVFHAGNRASVVGSKPQKRQASPTESRLASKPGCLGKSHTSLGCSSPILTRSHCQGRGRSPRIQQQHQPPEHVFA